MLDVTVRPYTPVDRTACLTIFDTNVPTFFAPDERDGFASFLDQGGKYLVLCDTDGAIVGCGGVRVRADGQTAILRWGMIRAALHRRGLGRSLTLERLRQVSASTEIVRVVLYTTGQTAGFYRTLGFRDVAILPDHYGPGLDQHAMEAAVDATFRQQLAAHRRTIRHQGDKCIDGA